MMPPVTKAVTGPPKTILKYDEKGMIIEKANYRANGELAYKTTYKYDEEGRLQEMQVIHPNGTRYRWESRYEGQKRFPESEASFVADNNKPRSRVTYSNYELNPQGDWTKRRMTRTDAEGKTYISIEYQVLEYYQ
jgi:hypothetical protein